MIGRPKTWGSLLRTHLLAALARRSWPRRPALCNSSPTGNSTTQTRLKHKDYDTSRFIDIQVRPVAITRIRRQRSRLSYKGAQGICPKSSCDGGRYGAGPWCRGRSNINLSVRAFVAPRRKDPVRCTLLKSLQLQVREEKRSSHPAWAMDSRRPRAKEVGMLSVV